MDLRPEYRGIRITEDQDYRDSTVQHSQHIRKSKNDNAVSKFRDSGVLGNVN